MVYRPENLRLRIEKLREYARDLDVIGELTLEEYLGDRHRRYTVERVLFLICESIFDFLDHILASRFDVVSESYEGIIENAFERGVIQKELFGDLKGLGGFRNILAHGYMRIENAEVHRNLVKMRRIVPAVIDGLERLIDKP